MMNPLKSKGVVIALVLVAAGVVMVRFGKWPSGKPILLARARPAPAPFVEENFQVRPRPNIAWERVGATSSASPLRDPFAWPYSTNTSPADVGVPGKESLVLQAISIDAGRAVAVLNRRVVSVGESVGQYTVEKILPSEVWIRGPGGQLVLRLAR
jgi:hypothetical protein